MHILCFQDFGGLLVVLVWAALETVHRCVGGWVHTLGKVFPVDLVSLALAVAGLHVFDLLWVHGVLAKVGQGLGMCKYGVDVLQEVGMWIMGPAEPLCDAIHHGLAFGEQLIVVLCGKFHQVEVP